MQQTNQGPNKQRGSKFSGFILTSMYHTGTREASNLEKLMKADQKKAKKFPVSSQRPRKGAVYQDRKLTQ